MAGKKYTIGVLATGDVDDAVRALRKLERSTGKVSKSIRGALKTGAAVGAAALGTGLVLAARSGYKELMETQKVSARTGSVLESMGRKAEFSVKGIEARSKALSRMSGTDDQAIQSGMNLLLGFDKIGKRNGVFDRATKAALDFSVATGKDMTQAARLVGRALQAPERAGRSLRSMNVELTKSEQEKIKAWTESGKTAAAQNFILGKLQKTYGKSAEEFGKTGPAAVMRAKNAFDDMSATILEKLAPSITVVANKAAKLSERIAAWTESREGQKTIEDIKRSMDALGRAVERVARFLVDNRKIVIAVVAVLGTMDLAFKAARIALTTYAAALKVVKALQVVWVAVMKSARIATIMWTAAQWALNAAWTANPIGVIIVGVAALVAIMVVAYKKSETFRNIVNALGNVMKRLGKFLWDNKMKLLAMIPGFGLVAVGVIKLIQHFGTFKRAIQRIGSTAVTLKNTITGAFDTLVTFVSNLPKRITTAASGMWNGLRDAFKSAMNYIIDKWNAFKLEISLPKKLGGGSIGIDTPNIPKFASGGIVTSPTMAVVGEAGPEAIVPLGRTRRDQHNRQRLGIGNTINQTFNISNPVESIPTFMKRAEWAMRTQMARA